MIFWKGIKMSYLEQEFKKQHQEVFRFYPEFSRLIVKKTPKKLRNCLKCRVEFVSSSYGQRVCASCCAQNDRSSIRI
jgi:hypothetical protein